MIEGTMTWTNSTEEFGLLAPKDGGRVVFVRTPRADGGAVRPAEGITRHALHSNVEVRTRYQHGHWAGGYEIAGIVQSGYHVRRPGSPDVLPAIFVPADVRTSGEGR